MMNCEQCGKVQRANATFCSECGTKIENNFQGNATIPIENNNVQTQPPKKKRKGLKILLLFCVFAVIGFFAFGYLEDSGFFDGSRESNVVNSPSTSAPAAPAPAPQETEDIQPASSNQEQASSDMSTDRFIGNLQTAFSDDLGRLIGLTTNEVETHLGTPDSEYIAANGNSIMWAYEPNEHGRWFSFVTFEEDRVSGVSLSYGSSNNIFGIVPGDNLNEVDRFLSNQGFSLVSEEESNYADGFMARYYARRIGNVVQQFHIHYDGNLDHDRHLDIGVIYFFERIV